MADDNNPIQAIGDIKFRQDAPTILKMPRLSQWVIWQFPRPHRYGFCGAIRPSLPGGRWWPAIIDASAGKVVVYAHHQQRFDSPEEAAGWLATIEE
jgi:hypothetical protein